ILALLLFRLLWGFAGPRYARFASFPPNPVAAIAWLRGARSARAGHNPVGAFSVYAMLAALALQAVTGLFATDDIMWDGPLKAQVSNATSALLTGVHKVNRFVVLALIALHLVAIAWYGSVRKEPLVRAMIDGDKAVATVAGEPSPEPAADGARERVLALALLGLSAVAVW